MDKPRTLTVGELKKLLANVNDDVLVGCDYPAHDHMRTTLFGTIRKAEISTVQYSAYHTAFKVLDADDEEKAENIDELPTVLVLC
jgi:hypothetical protein